MGADNRPADILAGSRDVGRPATRELRGELLGKWELFFEGVEELSDNFMSGGRTQPEAEQRDEQG